MGSASPLPPAGGGGRPVLNPRCAERRWGPTKLPVLFGGRTWEKKNLHFLLHCIYLLSKKKEGGGQTRLPCCSLFASWLGFFFFLNWGHKAIRKTNKQTHNHIRAVLLFVGARTWVRVLLKVVLVNHLSAGIWEGERGWQQLFAPVRTRLWRETNFIFSCSSPPAP